VSCVVPEAHLQRAMAALHRAFFPAQAPVAGAGPSPAASPAHA
jgi:hypothetical protein